METSINLYYASEVGGIPAQLKIEGLDNGANTQAEANEGPLEFLGNLGTTLGKTFTTLSNTVKQNGGLANVINKGTGVASAVGGLVNTVQTVGATPGSPAIEGAALPISTNPILTIPQPTYQPLPNPAAPKATADPKKPDYQPWILAGIGVGILVLAFVAFKLTKS